VNSITIYVCENQPVLVEGLQRIIDGFDDLEIVGQASDMGIAIAELAGIPADIFLIGQPFSAKSILPLLSQAREADLSSSIVLWIGDLSEMDSFRALQMGAKGIIRKTQPVSIVIECLRTVASGSIYLESSLRSPNGGLPRRNGVLRITRREREIVEFVCRGMKNKEIAEALSITPGTVKVHLMHIFEKTGVKDRFQLALQGRQFLSAAEADAAAVRKIAEV
jgi:two-component system nitrate/nitrite response regulator NarL